MSGDTDDLITTERVYIVARRLSRGESGTAREIAGWIGVSRQAAYDMLAKISRVGPVVSIDGKWIDCQAVLDCDLLQCDADDR